MLTAYLDRLDTTIAGIKMKTPIFTGSGTFGFGMEFNDYLDLNQVGAVVVKGITLQPRPGNLGRRMAETPAGMLNAVGLENPGAEDFLVRILPQLKDFDVPVVVNISGNSIEEYGQLAAMMTTKGISALEVNISCPNVKQGCLAFGVQAEAARQVTQIVKKNTTLPVIVKLSPNVTDIVEIATAVETGGANAISLVNTFLGMAIDIETCRPVLGNITGGLSGPAIKPIALRMVWQVAQAVKVPVIGMGGIMSAADAIEFLLAGASAVSIGTANFIDPGVAVNIAAGIGEYLVKKEISHVSQLVGKLQIS